MAWLDKPNRMRWAASLALLFLILAAVIKVDSQANSSIQTLVESNARQGRVMQALYHVEALAVFNGWTPDLHRRAGDLWAQTGDLTRAIPHWQTASRTLDDTALLSQLADAYLQTQQWSEAAQTLQKLLELAPDDRWAHYQIGLIRVAFDPAAAEAHLRVAARVPEYADTAARLLDVIAAADSSVAMRVGLTLAGVELWPYAELAFQHAADTAYPYAEALAYTGLARDWQGKDGSLWIQQAAALEPQNAVVRYLQGLHLRGRGDYVGSRDAFVQAVALDPLNPAYYAELGTSYGLLDDLQGAERWLKMAVEISEGDPRFQQALDQFYAESGLPEPGK